MEIQSAGSHAVYSYLNITSRQKCDTAAASAGFAASSANNADTVAISSAARDLFAGRTNAPTVLGGSATTVVETTQGPMTIDDYFKPAAQADGSLATLPPLLLPNPKTIDALTRNISENFPQFLAANNIPSAPTSITYDSAGQIQLPADYPYADQFKQALENDPTMERKLRTVSALTSHLVEMRKSIPFQEEYAAATTQAEIDAVVAKYSYLFSDNKQYSSIALNFSASGELSLSADGKPLA
ncbi:MAG: hypothetical protein WC001_04125 [Desulfurivibrionaceae bacterium]